MLTIKRLKEHSLRTALLQQGRALNYGELDTWSSAIAATLLTNGSLQSGTPIGLLAPASFEYFAGLLGIWKAGAMAVPLQPAHPLEELKHIVDDASMSLILTAPALQALGDQLTSPKTALWPIKSRQELDRTTTENIPVECHAGDGALMIYTSGTTGKPKGVVTTRAALEAQIESLLSAWQWSENDSTLNVLPLHHVHGVVVLACCALTAGARMEVVEKFQPELVWKRISTQAINVFMAVPTVYAKLVQHWQTQNPEVQKLWSEGAKRMRLMVSGSAALPVPLFESWKKISSQPLLERYGMTEMGIALSNPYAGVRKAGYVGKPLAGVEVRLADEGGVVLTNPNSAGELQVRGPIVFREYWRKPEATAESFTADGWFKTGDIAECDHDGDYKILGRNSQDIIKTGGYKVSALEIENVLLEHPVVKEVGVVGVADDTWGERVAAFMVCDKSITDDELTAFLQAKLARYKIPTVWRRVEALPRNAMGKVLKKKLVI
ncbi:MAG: acyl-CoA synthetase [Bdellovibrionales bacterium]|nr:acyl-CoA synthetase [Bdellovibrionales bacterium]